MSWEAVQAVLENSVAHEAARLVLVCIAERANGHNECFPSVADISRRAHLNSQVTSRIIDRLAESGDLIRWIRVGASTHYIVTAGLNKQQIEANVLAAWNMTIKQVESANKDAIARLSRSKGNKATLLANLEGLDPSSESSEPFERKSTDPSSEARTEPEDNHQNPNKSISTSVEFPPKNGHEPLPAKATIASTHTGEPIVKKGKQAKPAKAPKVSPLYNEIFKTVSDICVLDTTAKSNAGKVGKAAVWLDEKGVKPNQVCLFGEWFKVNHWKGQRGDVPGTQDIFDNWRKFAEGHNTAARQTVSANGYSKQAEPESRLGRGNDF